MDMREQIASTICGDKAVDNWDATDADYELADAIISVIAESVEPLEWEAEHDFWCAELFECETGFGKYSTFLAVGNSEYSWCLEDGPDMPEQHGLASLEAAKAAAQADYSRRILAALGVK